MDRSCELLCNIKFLCDILILNNHVKLSQENRVRLFEYLQVNDVISNSQKELSYTHTHTHTHTHMYIYIYIMSQ